MVADTPAAEVDVEEEAVVDMGAVAEAADTTMDIKLSLTIVTCAILV